MTNRFRNISATLLSLSIAAPFALHGNEPALIDAEINETEVMTDDYNIAASELLKLDDEALDELTELGYEMTANEDELASHIIDYATQYLGRPYRHGSQGPKSFDCSGFTRYVFKEYGIELSPSSRTQYTQGEKISLDEVRPGDLLFFGGRAGGKTVGHVALAVDVDENGTITFIHAATSGGIRYDTYPDGGYYSKRYIGARRVIE